MKTNLITLTFIFVVFQSIISQENDCPNFTSNIDKNMECSQVSKAIENYFKFLKIESIKAVLQNNQCYKVETTFKPYPKTNFKKIIRLTIPSKCMLINAPFSINENNLQNNTTQNCNSSKSALSYFNAVLNQELDIYKTESEKINIHTNEVLGENLNLTTSDIACDFNFKTLLLQPFEYRYREVIRDLRFKEIKAKLLAYNQYEIVTKYYEPYDIGNYFSTEGKTFTYEVEKRIVPATCMPKDVPFQLNYLDKDYRFYGDFQTIPEESEEWRSLNLYLEAEKQGIFDANYPIEKTTVFIEQNEIDEIIEKLKGDYSRKSDAIDDEQKKNDEIKEETKRIEAQFLIDFKNSMFYALNGGKYLYAIYDDNFDEIRKLDAEYLKNTRESYEKADAITKVFLQGLSEENSSMLNLIMMEYMHEYKKNKQKCFKDGAMSFNFNKTTSKFQTVNGYGWVTGTYGGDELFGHYLVNKEFAEICKRSAGVRNLSNDIWSNHPLVIGTKSLNKYYDCDSKEIKRFENNLISLFKKFYYKN